MENAYLHRIGEVRTPFRTKFGIPHQSGLVDSVRGCVVFERDYASPEWVRGLEKYTYIWIIWGLSESDKGISATVRPPKLGGNCRVGVFASRAPFRPNGLGLSCVRLVQVEFRARTGSVLHIAGADMLDHSPVYDIKPYVPADCHPEAEMSFAALPEKQYTVADPAGALLQFPEETAAAVRELLALDPRPAYHQDPKRIYAMEYEDFEVHFSVSDSCVTVISVQPLSAP